MSTLNPDPKKLLEGMARCVDSEGLEHVLSVGDLVYVREIPNMPGHGIIMKDDQAPLVGYHLDRFVLLKEEDGGW